LLFIQAALISTASMGCSDTNGPDEVTQPADEWAIMGGGPGADIGFAVAVHRSGDVAVTGLFSGTANFGTKELVAHGGSDIFVSKYDRQGKFLWAQGAGGRAWDEGLDVAIDRSGNVVVTGLFSQTAGGADGFVASYDPAGTLLWVQAVQGPNLDVGSGVSTDGSDNVIVTGQFWSSATFGDTTLTGAGDDSDIFVAKYDVSGNLLWVRANDGTGNDAGREIAVDRSGNAVVAGYFGGEATFGDTTVTTAGTYDVFVAKYDVSGSVLWVRTARGAFDDLGRGVAVDASGNVLVTGIFSNELTFETTSIKSAGEKGIFVAKYDPAGTFLWARAAGGTSLSEGSGVATDGAGNVIVTGIFNGSAKFASTTITTVGGTDVFIAKYDPLGNLLWVWGGGGPDADKGEGVAADESGSLVVTGYFAYTAMFGATKVTSAGRLDVFVASMGPGGFE
jgi:hypothetical protein